MSAAAAPGGPLPGSGRTSHVLGIGCGALAATCGVALPAVAAWLLVDAAGGRTDRLTEVAVGLGGLALASAASGYVGRLAGHATALRALAGQRIAAYRRLAPLVPAGRPELRGGGCLRHFVADVDAQRARVPEVHRPAVAVAVAVGGAVATVAVLHLPSGLVLLGGGLAAGLAVPAGIAAYGRRAGRRLDAARADRTAVCDELLRSLPVLTAFGAADTHLDRLSAADARVARTSRRLGTAAGLGSALAELCRGAAVAGVLVMGVGGGLDGPAVAVAVVLSWTVSGLLARVPPLVGAELRVAAAAARLRAVLDTPPPAVEPATPRPPSTGTQPPTLGLHAARLTWPDGVTGAPLDGLDLVLPPGRRVAVVGPGGEALAMVLPRFADLTGGRYTIGGTDATGLDGVEVRRLVAYCPPDPHVFDATLRDNVLVAGPEADDPALLDVLERAGLTPPAGGLDAAVDTALSGPDRQRLELARALLAGVGVLVLDRPAAELAPAAADALVGELLAATQGHTVVLVTHRVTGLDQLDEVVLLDAGRVVQRGTVAALRAVDGPFRHREEREAGAAHSVEDPESFPQTAARHR